MSDCVSVQPFLSHSVYDRLQALVINSVRSVHSKRAYAAGLAEFCCWWQANAWPPLSKAVVQQLRSDLEQRGLAPATINLRLAAVRRLVLEAADNGLVPPGVAAAIARVQGVRPAGVRLGNWLSREQAQELLLAPDQRTTRGVRDRAMLAVLIGCGLRRNELVQFTFEHLQMRDGRWVIADLLGKGERVRTVVVPDWAKAALDEWQRAGGSAAGPVFRAINKRGAIGDRRMSPQAVRKVVACYAEKVGVRVAPHDLRRTYARLSRQGGADIEQVQLSLGHASVQTTERYLGGRLDLLRPPCDYLGLKLPARAETDPNTVPECVVPVQESASACNLS